MAKLSEVIEARAKRQARAIERIQKAHEVVTVQIPERDRKARRARVEAVLRARDEGVTLDQLGQTMDMSITSVRKMIIKGLAGGWDGEDDADE